MAPVTFSFSNSQRKDDFADEVNILNLPIANKSKEIRAHEIKTILQDPPLLLRNKHLHEILDTAADQ